MEVQEKVKQRVYKSYQLDEDAIELGAMVEVKDKNSKSNIPYGYRRDCYHIDADDDNKKYRIVAFVTDVVANRGLLEKKNMKPPYNLIGYEFMYMVDGEVDGQPVNAELFSVVNTIYRGIKKHIEKENAKSPKRSDIKVYHPCFPRDDMTKDIDIEKETHMLPVKVMCRRNEIDGTVERIVSSFYYTKNKKDLAFSHPEKALSGKRLIMDALLFFEGIFIKGRKDIYIQIKLSTCHIKSIKRMKQGSQILRFIENKQNTKFEEDAGSEEEEENEGEGEEIEGEGEEESQDTVIEVDVEEEGDPLQPQNEIEEIEPTKEVLVKQTVRKTKKSAVRKH